MDHLNHLVMKHFHNEVYTSEIDSYADYNDSYDEFDYFNNVTEYSAEPLSNSKAASKHCNYFDATQSWGNFLIFNFAFLYLLPIIIMTISYGLIMKKVN